MTRVINIRRNEHGLDLGQLPDGYVNIMRPTLFGNPFNLKRDFDGDRERCLKSYAIYFKRMIRKKWFRENIMKLKDKTLVCCCDPLPCHGHVIAEYLNSH